MDAAVMPPPEPGAPVPMQGPIGGCAPIILQPKAGEHMVGGPAWPLAPPLVPYNFGPPGGAMHAMMPLPKGPPPAGKAGKAAGPGKGGNLPKAHAVAKAKAKGKAFGGKGNGKPKAKGHVI